MAQMVPALLSPTPRFLDRRDVSARHSRLSSRPDVSARRPRLSGRRDVSARRPGFSAVHPRLSDRRHAKAAAREVARTVREAVGDLAQFNLGG